MHDLASQSSLTLTLSREVDGSTSARSDKSSPSSFKISAEGLQLIVLIASNLLMQPSICGLYFSTQAAEDAMTAKSPNISMISPDNLNKAEINA